MNVKEVKESEKAKMANSIEVFRKNNSEYSCRIPFHTDFYTELEDYSPEEEVEEAVLMDKEDYSNSVLANSSINFEDMFDKDDKILCILLKKSMNEV